MGLISGGQKTVTSSTAVDSSQHTLDNKVAAQNSNVIASGGGALTNQAGSTILGSGSTINQVDPGSYAFASHVIDAALKSGSDTVAGVGSTLSQVGAAIAGAGPSSSVPAAPSSGGFKWKPLVWVAAALVGVVGLVVMLKRRRA